MLVKGVSTNGCIHQRPSLFAHKTIRWLARTPKAPPSVVLRCFGTAYIRTLPKTVRGIEAVEPRLSNHGCTRQEERTHKTLESIGRERRYAPSHGNPSHSSSPAASNSHILDKTSDRFSIRECWTVCQDVTIHKKKAQKAISHIDSLPAIRCLYS